MALAERKVEVAQEGGVTVGKITDTIVDEKTGVVAQKETIAMEVPNERGGTNVIVTERLRAVKVPNWIQQKSITSAQPQQLELTAQPANTTTTANTNRRSNNSGGSNLCDLVCLTCFLPCITNKFCLFVWIFLVVSGSGSLIPLTIIWPFKNCDDMQLTIRILLVLLSVIPCIMLFCSCYAYCIKKDPSRTIRNVIYICTGTFGLVFIAFVITASLFVFDFGRYDDSTWNCDGINMIIPLAVVSFSYLLIVLFSVMWCYCCYQCWKTLQDN